MIKEENVKTTSRIPAWHNGRSVMNTTGSGGYLGPFPPDDALDKYHM